MATITVTTLNDVVNAGDGMLSLREAVTLANANANADIITFQTGLSGLIRLTSGELTLSSDISIDGDTNGDTVADITISGDADSSGGASVGDSRIFAVNGVTTNVILDSLSLTRGYGDSGGAIALSGGASLLLRDSSITNSRTTNTLSSGGGAIDSYGGSNLTVLRSTIAGNWAYAAGGIAAEGGSLTIISSLITDNTASSYGAGPIFAVKLTRQS